MNKLKANRGFTLIELLVVIAIIGLLSSVVLASLNSAREKSRDARRISDVKQLQTALELFFDDQSTPEYPDALSSLSSGGYIASVATDPSTGSAYGYDNLSSSNGSCSVSSGACTKYVIGATIENTSHSVLSGDVDTDRGAVSCDASGEYCVQP